MTCIVCGAVCGKPTLLDLFSGAGGAARGYQRAGFCVLGVDNRPQPRYAGDRFVQADAMTFPLEGYDAIHASPPCQAFTVARVIHNRTHPDLLAPTRERLKKQAAPWVIENVPNAPIRADLTLCGSMFGQPRLKRHRHFEWGQDMPLSLQPSCCHARDIVSVFGHGGHIYHGVADWRVVMGIDWMNRDELSEAIPPAYCEYVGRQLLQVLS